MDLKIKSQYAQLYKKLEALEQVPTQGKLWAQQSGFTMHRLAGELLTGQGRGSGGSPPPLSAMTLHIYGITGGPTGDAVHDHLELMITNKDSVFKATVGILDGHPTMVAKVQNDGAIIPVTQAMRGYLSANFGINLRAETTHLEVPARHFWDDALRLTKAEAVRGLRQLLKV